MELQVLQVDVPELQCAYLAEAQSACQKGEPEREPLVVGEERGQPVDLVGVTGGWSRRLDCGLTTRYRHGLAGMSGGVPSACSFAAASMIRLSVRAACSNVHAVNVSLAFAYHSSTICRVMRSSGVSPNVSLSRRSTIPLHRLDRPDSLLPSGLRYLSK